MVKVDNMEDRIMKRITMVAAALFLLILSAGCAVLGPYAVDPALYRAEKGKAASKDLAEKAKYEVMAYDQEMYMARARARHLAVAPLKPGEVAAVIVENPGADIIDPEGYRDGLAVAFLNDSADDLRVRVDDPHGQFFSFTIAKGETKVMNLEQGNYRVRSRRLSDSVYRTDGLIGVHADKTYHVDGKSYYGYAEFSGSGFGWR